MPMGWPIELIAVDFVAPHSGMRSGARTHGDVKASRRNLWSASSC
jgi:hypothetical protein